MSFADSSVSSRAASRTYRIKNLKRAHIYVKQLDRSEWPAEILQLADFLTSDSFTGILSPGEVVKLLGHTSARQIPRQAIFDGEDATRPIGCARALFQALALDGATKAFYGRTEAHWMSLAEAILADVRACEQLAFSKDEEWDEPVEMMAGEGAPLSTPKPDLAFGLRLEQAASSVTADLPSRAPPLSEEFLEATRLRLGLHPWPSMALPEIAFPCIVFEAKSDSSVLFFAENQAAGAAAKALSMLQGLEEESSKLRKHTCQPDADDSLPVIVMCAMGDLWEFMIAFRRAAVSEHTQPDTHLVKVWMGSVSEPWAMLQLQVLLQRTVHWIISNFRPRVRDMLDRIRATM